MRRERVNNRNSGTAKGSNPYRPKNSLAASKRPVAKGQNQRVTNLPQVPLELVVSSQLDAVGYDARTSRLAVRFKAGSEVYTYSGVPQAIYSSLLYAESLGGYFAKNIKNRYSFTKDSRPSKMVKSPRSSL